MFPHVYRFFSMLFVVSTLAAMLLSSPIPTFAADPHTRGTLSAVQERGYLRCGVNDIPGYAGMQSDGSWRGFEVDFCRAVAAAVVGDARAVEPVTLFSDARFTGLVEGDVDLVHANVTWTLTREVAKGVAFTAVMEYDGQGLLAYRDSDLSRLADAAGRGMTLCVVVGTTTESNIRDYNAQHGLGLKVLTFESFNGVWGAFNSRQCDLVTSDRTLLSQYRAAHTANSNDTVMLTDVISREPLAALVRNGDPAWETLVRWMRHALVIAEEKGVTAANVQSMADSSTDPEVRRLLGVDSGMGALLGLDDGWARRAIAAVGNYGEIFTRNLGAESPYGRDRGMNVLWRDGGLLYAPPLR